MDDTQRIVKCGNLSLHTAGGFFKKKWHNKYLVLYDGSKSGIKRLEMFDSEIKFKKQNAAKIIALVDCVRVVTCQRNKTTYTFELRTSEQFYLLAAQSFQDMNDWVNCLRLVAFGEATNSKQQQSFASPPLNPKRLQQQQQQQLLPKQTSKEPPSVDVLLDKRSVPNLSNQSAGVQLNPIGGLQQQQQQPASKITTASQAMMAASSALAKTRQRQPSLLGSCKPQPPTDSPFIQQQQYQQQLADNTCFDLNPKPLNAIGDQIDTLTPTVRGQLIGVAGNQLAAAARQPSQATCEQSPARQQQQQPHPRKVIQRTANSIQATLDEEEENMLYCSIEDNPSEHNYRVKVIESQLSLRCQLKCYQLTTPNAVSQQYDQIGNFKAGTGAYQSPEHSANSAPVVFYQLIIGPQELTLLNDYALGVGAAKQQQGLWSWPYQCIRRYGFDKDNCFMFEAGRKCTSGPGQFIVQTPKAYSIYQDVVKFVNELRCVSGVGAADRPVAMPPASLEEAKPASSSVTQIPVSWAPDGLDSRRHFFNSLRQMGQSTPVQQQQPNNGQQTQRVVPEEDTNSSLSSLTRGHALVPPHHHNYHHHHLMHRNPATIPELCEHSSSSSSSSSSTASSSSSLTKNSLLAKESSSGSMESAPSLKTGTRQPNISDVTSEETDESGYEQGDDSVDSSSSRSRLLAAELKQHHSMSSSSSSTSSSSGSAGIATDSTSGPLYSVIQRPRPARESESTKQEEVAPLSRRWPPLKPPEVKQRHDLMEANMRTSNTEKLLSRLIVDGPTNRPEQDFEANLIRDVYSEITKLHATFAVTPYTE